MSGVDPSPGQNEEPTPFDPLYSRISEIRQIASVLEYFIELDNFYNIAEDVVELPPEERYTSSHELVKERIKKEFDFTNFFSPSVQDDLQNVFLRLTLNAVVKELEELRNETFRLAIREEEAEFLIFGMFLTKLRDSADQAENHLSDEETLNQIFSCYFALISRLVVLTQSNKKEIGEGVVRDIGFTDHYLNRAIGRDVEDPIKDYEYPELRDHVVTRGALLSYSLFDISLEEAADLAEVSETEFKSLLSNYGIARRLPSSLQNKANSLAIVEDTHSTDLMINAIESYLEERVSDEEIQQEIADAYYKDELTYEQLKQLVGGEEADNFAVLKSQLKDDELREELAFPDDSGS